MLLFGIVALINQNIPDSFFLASYLSLTPDFQYLFSIISIIMGILILIITVKQNPHQKETVTWMVVALLLGVVGGTLGGLITLGGTLIYNIFYFL